MSIASHRLNTRARTAFARDKRLGHAAAQAKRERELAVKRSKVQHACEIRLGGHRFSEPSAWFAARCIDCGLEQGKRPAELPETADQQRRRLQRACRDSHDGHLLTQANAPTFRRHCIKCEWQERADAPAVEAARQRHEATRRTMAALDTSTCARCGSADLASLTCRNCLHPTTKA